MTGQLTGHLSVGITVKIASNANSDNLQFYPQTVQTGEDDFLTYYYRSS